jgi:alpha-1,6-mannosyltransferase
MRILQLANFYHSRSGGLRTAVDALGAGYVSAGHEVFLAIPGQEQTVRQIDGRTVITLRGPRLPKASEYRTIVDQRAVSDLVAAVRPDVIELSDRTTLARLPSISLSGHRSCCSRTSDSTSPLPAQRRACCNRDVW